MLIQLSSDSDPRFLLIDELPERVTMEDLGEWRYGKLMLFAFDTVDAVYTQPEGPGTDWVRPEGESCSVKNES